ncbi:hypothetical protein [Pseudomonas syringae]|uniref:hypothetical protein n=1 Tax=Pseudomonas syringae TaxID=317 RepID=UPI0011C4ACCB|nr:hypothetical protein [Pseudomonas syringae]
MERIRQNKKAALGGFLFVAFATEALPLDYSYPGARRKEPNLSPKRLPHRVEKTQPKTDVLFTVLI